MLKYVVGAIVIAIVLGGILISRTPPAEAKDRTKPTDEMYSGLRNLALTTKADDLDIRPSGLQDPYAVVMDIDMNGATATVTSFSTGDASLYLSTGGGIIGAGQSSPTAAAAAKRFVETAKSYLAQMMKKDGHPLPGSGETTFYVVTPSGTFTAIESTDELGKRKSQLSPLFYAGQDVLTQIRLTQDQPSK